MPRFIPFAEPALSGFSSVKEPFVRRKTFSEIEGQYKLTREEKTTSIFFLLLK